MNEYAQARPAPPLRPYVAWYSGYRQRGVAPARHRGLPSPYLTVIFTLDEPLTVAAHPDARQAAQTYDALVGGLHTTPALITHAGAQSGVQLALGPLGARVLLGLPAGELGGLDLPADAVLGRFAGEVCDRLRSAGDWRDRFAVLDAALLARLRPDRAVSEPVARAWRALLRGGGAVPAGALASEAGWSGRHLADRFRAEIGLTPKAAARVVRFDRARRLLAARAAASGSVRGVDDGLGLAALAAECGYFDQAHMAREFRALAGCPPSRWLAEEFRNVQVTEVLGAEGWEDEGPAGPGQWPAATDHDPEEARSP
ncbi:AraC family transcriptional regulator [Streptomyces sp. ICBB 8177]|nr:AraC family transcriptional regulator [Streptomyces sp. ICBB 8177]